MQLSSYGVQIKETFSHNFENKIIIEATRKRTKKTQDIMDKTNQFNKIVSTRKEWTDDNIPPCLYPEVVVIPHGSVSSISVSSDLARPPKSGGYWACSESSLMDNITAYQIPLRSSTRKRHIKNRICNRLISLFLSCSWKTRKTAIRTKSVTSVRSVGVAARSGNVITRSVQPVIQRLRKRHEDMYAIFNEDQQLGQNQS